MEGSPWGRLIALYVLFALGHLLYVGVVNPEVLRHRARPKKGTEPWDWIWLAVFMLTFIAIFVVAGFDIANEWAPLPPWASNVGVVLFVLGGGLFLVLAERRAHEGHDALETGLPEPHRTEESFDNDETLVGMLPGPVQVVEHVGLPEAIG